MRLHGIGIKGAVASNPDGFGRGIVISKPFQYVMKSVNTLRKSSILSLGKETICDF